MREATRTRPPARGRRPPPRARRRARRRLPFGPGGRIAAALIALLVIVLGVGAALGATGDDGDAPASVEVAGVDVSGLSPDEVERAVRYRARQLMAQPIVIVRGDAPDRPIRVARRSLGARPQVDRAVAEALEPRSLGGKILGGLGVAPTREVDIGFTVRQARVNALVDRVAGDLDDPPVPARLRVTKDDIVVLPGKSGFGIDEFALRDRIAAMPEEPIDVEVGPQPPPVSQESAEAARELALRVIAKPVDIAFQGRGVPVEPAVLRSALRFAPDPPDLDVRLDPDTLYRRIASAYSTREQPARDATWRLNGATATLVPSRVGRKLDMQSIAASIVDSPGAPSVRARFAVSQPELTTDEARALNITELVSEFSTPYNCCEPRVTNIQRAAKTLDGMVLEPGWTFSLNDALGPRTTERGYVEAPQILGGKLEDGIGGGVSQVSTTLYNAAFFAGMELIDHTPHQFWISRYPEGREATLSYGGPDLVFRNDWDAGVLIDAVAGDNAVTIRFYSSKLGRRVETETGERSDYEEPEINETVNPDLEPGARVVEQYSGGPGFTVSYTREVWQGDELKRDETYTWHYSAQDAFVELGPTPKPKRGGPRAGTTPEEPGAPDEPAEPGDQDGGAPAQEPGGGDGDVQAPSP
jgi:vancomycin resistance protein YoaR